VIILRVAGSMAVSLSWPGFTPCRQSEPMAPPLYASARDRPFPFGTLRRGWKPMTTPGVIFAASGTLQTSART